MSVRLLVTVERAALRPVLVSSSLATPDPGAAGGEVGFIFPAGTPVDPDLSFHGAIPIPTSSSWIEGTGWVDASAVDAYAEVEEPRRCWAEDLTLIELYTPILDREDGYALVEVETPWGPVALWAE